MAFKVVIPQPIVPTGVEYLKAHGCEVVVGNGDMSAEYLKQIVVDADALLIRTATYSAEVLSAAKNLKVIGRFGVGLDNVDLEYCRANDIVVTIAPGANSNSVAEHTIMFILMLARKAIVQDGNTRSGNYEGRNTNPGNDVQGKTLAILGMGRIGRLVAQKAHDGLGMKIVSYDPVVTQEMAPEYVTMVDQLHEAVTMGDFVTVNIPVAPKDGRMINKAFLASMKESAYLINVSRGSLVDEDALAEALRDHKIAGAALDVYQDEPYGIAEKLAVIRDNLILTPHSAGLTVEAKEEMALRAAQGIVSVMRGERPEFPAPGF